MAAPYCGVTKIGNNLPTSQALQCTQSNDEAGAVVNVTYVCTFGHAEGPATVENGIAYGVTYYPDGHSGFCTVAINNAYDDMRECECQIQIVVD
jgi:hypothetical protein